MFKNRSTEKELLDDFSLSGPDLEQNLRELEIINKWLGGHTIVIDAIKQAVKKTNTSDKVLSIADLGCGGGEILSELAKWAKKEKIQCRLFGIDANQTIIDIASKKNRALENVNFLQQDIFSAEFKEKKFDFIICSLILHHFEDNEITTLMRQLHQQTNYALIINDLHRHPLAYYSIRLLANTFSKSRLLKNDAPLSVLKAFSKREFQKLCSELEIQNYNLRWKWAFRWQLIIYKS